MSAHDQAINLHYGHGDLSATILATLQKAGKNIDRLTRDDLRAFDEFHFGGIEETRSLARLACLKEGISIVDVGSGLGGPARTLAAEFGCHVTGLDLTEEFCHAAEMLTERTGLNGQVTFQWGNALEMPFADSIFDVAWTQFAGMNIEDKPQFYSECRRVLKDGGRLAFHEVMAGTVNNLHYPAFWANDASLSFLRRPEEIHKLLTESGFKQVEWQDVTEHTAQLFDSLLERARQNDPLPLDLSTFVVDNLPQKAANALRNMKEQRMVVVMAVFDLEKEAV